MSGTEYGLVKLSIRASSPISASTDFDADPLTRRHVLDAITTKYPHIFSSPLLTWSFQPFLDISFGSTSRLDFCSEPALPRLGHIRQDEVIWPCQLR